MGHPTISTDFLDALRIVEGIGHRSLRVGEQVRVAERDVGGLVPHALGYRDHAETHMDEHGDVAVPKIVHPDALHTGEPAATIQLVAEERLRHPLEDPVVWPYLEDKIDVFPDFLAQKLRNGDLPVGLLRLRRTHNCLATLPREALVYGKDSALEIEVGGRERQKLALAYTRPEQEVERIVAFCLVADRVKEPVELVLAPYLHLARPRFACLCDLLHRVGIELVVPFGMVEQCGQLAVELPDVGRR